MSAPPATSPFAETPKRLGQALMAAGRLTEEQLAQALQAQANSRTFIGETLVEMGIISPDELVPLLLKHCKVPYVSLLDYLVDESLFELVGKPICKEHRLLPIDKMGRTLTIAMVNPLDTAAISLVQQQNETLRVKPILCDPEHFKEVAARVLASGKADKNSSTMSMSSLGLGPSKKVTKESPEPSTPAPAEPTVAEAPAAAEPTEAPASAAPSDPPAEEPTPDTTAESAAGEVSRAAVSADLNAAMNDMWGLGQDSADATYEILARRLRLFHRMSPFEIGNMFAMGETLEVEEGDKIFAKGDSGDKLYAILSGKVRIIDEGKEIAILASGDTFGEMGLVTGEPRSADAIAAEKSSLFIMNIEVFRDVLSKDGAIRILLNIVGTMSERLRGSNSMLRGLVK